MPATLRRFSQLAEPFVPSVQAAVGHADQVSRDDVLALYRTYLPLTAVAGGFRTGGATASSHLRTMVTGSIASRHEWRRALDLCCGVGGSHDRLMALAGSVVLFDLVVEQLQLACGLHRVCGDATAPALPFRALAFDLIWSEDALSHIGNRTALMEECRRVLRPGGALAFFDLVRGSISRPRADRFCWAWSLARLETPGSYVCLLRSLGFEILAIDVCGGRMLRLQLQDEARRGDARPEAYISWLMRSRARFCQTFGRAAFLAQLERLRMYQYLRDGSLTYLFVVARLAA